jgi:hypothetical protein
MGRSRLWPLAWGLGAVIGALVALALVPFGPGWGAALAFPVVAILFSIGAIKERDGDEVAHLLRFTLGFTIGFLLATVPATLVHIASLVHRAPDTEMPLVAEQAAELRARLWPRWGLMALGLPGGAFALWLRWRRPKRPDAPQDGMADRTA